jgi:hypothetical protein
VGNGNIEKNKWVNLWEGLMGNENGSERRYGKSKHNSNIWRSLLFKLKTTCFGPFTGPSSGLKWSVRGDYTM